MGSNLPAFSNWCYAQSECWSEIAQARKANRKRGAWRRPVITGAVSKLEKELRSELEFTEHAIALVLAGETLENVQAEEIVDTAALEEAALDHHGLDRTLRSRAIDRKMLATILLLLARFRLRQLALANETIDSVYQASRTALLKRLKQPDAVSQPSTEALAGQVKTLFEGDSQRYYRDLLDDSPRSRGVRNIVEQSATLGEAVFALRILFDTESYRVSMLAEALVFASWMAAFRGAAVDGTAAALAAGDRLVSFELVGPLDKNTCNPCRSQVGVTVVANSLSDLYDPSVSLCEAGRACRHFWRIA